MRSAAKLAVTLLVVCSSRAASQVAITHVNVVDVESGTVRADRTVVIEGDRIRAITTSAPAGARTIDARGAYMIPGLWDMHVHLGMGGRSALALLVANGVTGVRDMGGKFDLVRSWRDSVTVGTLVGPRIEMSGPIVENARWLSAVRGMLAQSGDTVAARELGERIPVATPEEARAAAARVAALGVKLLKVRNDPQPDWVALHRLAAARLAGADSAGVMILAGTDLGTPLTYPGFAVHDELDLLVRDGGLSPRRALWAATLGPAQFFHLERDAGSVAGKVADLVLLDANPLGDIRAVGRIRAVVRSGRYLDRAALDALLASASR
jgi:imidazolonepropionase-like amidohydrolase